MRVLHVVGARPNFMKLAPTFRALAQHESVQQAVVHTGQHYDVNMSDVFFNELGLPVPDVNLRVGSGTHAQQTSEIMSRFEPVLQEHRPDLVLVYGDVNSTVAAALVCAKLLVRVGHVEAGLRSYDRSMPEEINRLLTDQMCELLFTPSQDADRNLLREGIPAERIFFVGNVMIDTLVLLMPKAEQRLPERLPSKFTLVTLHRPSNVDDLPWLRKMLSALERISDGMPVLFPIHPRTRQRLSEAGGSKLFSNGIRFLEPLPYLEFIALQSKATIVITDSGGIQEETTFLGIPCLTVRENTERPITVEFGTNTIVGRDTVKLQDAVKRILRTQQIGNPKIPEQLPLWDGHASERIARIVVGLS